jgi:hypothetical protein
MTTHARSFLTAFALLATATAALGAQGAPSVQLAFGYTCGDRFLIKNDGSQPVAIEWKTSGSQDRSQLHLNANESREIASASGDAVELWVNGKLVATEPKGNKPCGAKAGMNPSSPAPNVVVRPLDAQTIAGSDDPPSRVARLSSMQGGVSFQSSGSSDWAVATLNSSITTGDRLVADDGGRAELEIGSVAVRFGSSTDVTVTSLTDGLLQLGAPAGTMRISVYRITPSDTIEVDTPNGAISLLAAGNYRISTNRDGTQTTVSVERGRAELSGPNTTQFLEGNQTVRLSAGGNGDVQIASVPRPGPDGFDSWSSYRDGVLTSASSASDAYVNPDIPGARDLDAAGRWETAVDVGPIWYPTVVAAGWVPYRYGHWAWVEPWGWVWVADEPWGFAPFHYGRWAFVHSRWGWVPGPRIGRAYYSPALVAFADGNGFGVGIGFSAWFPLGPRDPFLPWYHHGDLYLRNVNGANVRGVVDINVFVHVRDVEHFHYANRTVAMTVVPTRAFAAGRPIGREVVKVDAARIGVARIEPHPGVVPAREAALGGPVAPRPRAAVERVVAVDVAGGRRVPGSPGAVLPGARRVEPPTEAGVKQAARPLVTRSPIPAATLPFETRQKAIAEHPGRPLEPQQIQNLRQGKPAGPQKDPQAARPPQQKKEEPRKAEPKEKKPV